MRYQHTQTAPLCLILIGVSAAMLVGAWLVPDLTVRIILLSSGALTFVLACSFRELTVRDEGERLLICFGPLPLFKRRILYDDIKSVQQSRTTILDGWGIHLSPSGGWTWNLWGFDCVDIYFKQGSRVRVGTDDSENLETFLRERLSDQ